MKILVIEDNENNLYLIKFILQKEGFEIIEARDGISGVELAIKEKPDLILMDIQLRGIDGIEATRRIKKSDVGRKIPIIALTSYAMPSDQEKTIKAGCVGYISKPINPEIFVSKIKDIYNNYKSG